MEEVRFQLKWVELRRGYVRRLLVDHFLHWLDIIASEWWNSRWKRNQKNVVRIVGIQLNFNDDDDRSDSAILGTFYYMLYFSGKYSIECRE